MSLNQSINFSKNALVIHLDQVHLEEIVEQKLAYFLKQRPLGKNILKIFYEPAEQALIEVVLKKLKGNQFKTARSLGINRNTLKKKILTYRLNIKELLIKEKEESGPQSRVFLSSVAGMDLLSACRTKLAGEKAQNKIPEENIMKQICLPVQTKIIQKVLEYCKGNQIRAAHFLGINRNTLKKRIKLSNGIRAG